PVANSSTRRIANFSQRFSPRFAPLSPTGANASQRLGNRATRRATRGARWYHQSCPARSRTPACRAPTMTARTTFILAAALGLVLWKQLPLTAQTDLDALMRGVLAVRDENWKKLQQYVLDEREQIELRGPSRTPIWGEQRDYLWFVRNGFFVRSPLRYNGA